MVSPVGPSGGVGVHNLIRNFCVKRMFEMQLEVEPSERLERTKTRRGCWLSSGAGVCYVESVEDTHK